MISAPLHNLEGVPSGGEAVFVKTKDGTQIRTAYWSGGDRGTILLFPGRTEYIEKYGRMVSTLQARNFNVVVIDWRGQGLSDRPDNRQDRGHVEHFDEYQQDIAAVLSVPKIAELSGPRVLFAHSMGGCIGLRAIVDDIDVKAAVFSAPMWGLEASAQDKRKLALVSALGWPIGLHKMLVPDTQPTFYVADTQFDDNTLTNDADFYAMMKSQLATQNAMGLGGPTIRWAARAFKEMEYLHTAKVPTIPILTFLGTEEAVVSSSAIKARSSTIETGRLEIVENAKHEIWMETPKVQELVWGLTDEFLKDVI